jgi:predicted metallo-beta-lactamase superfamily hydrolase
LNNTNNQPTNKVKNGSFKSSISTKTTTHHPHLTTQNKVKSSSNQQLQQRHQNQLKTVRSHVHNDNEVADSQAVELKNTIVEDLTNNLSHANKGVEALGVLVQYLVYNVSIDIMLLM